MNRLPPEEGTGVAPSRVTALENPQVRLRWPQHSPLKELCSQQVAYLGQVQVTLMAPPTDWETGPQPHWCCFP